jgi:hypothetical protein
MSDKMKVTPDGRGKTAYSEEEIMEEMEVLGLLPKCNLLDVTPEELLANYGNPPAIQAARAKACMSLKNKNRIIVGNHLLTLNDAIADIANFNKCRRAEGLSTITPQRAFEMLSLYNKSTGEYIPHEDRAHESKCPRCTALEEERRGILRMRKENGGKIHDQWLTASREKLLDVMEFQSAMTNVLSDAQDRDIETIKELEQQLEEAKQKMDDVRTHLINAQPHIQQGIDSNETSARFVDTHVTMALQIANEEAEE